MPIKIKKRVFLEEDYNQKLIKDIHNEEVIDVTKILPLVTPGTDLRDGLDEILHGNLGALIVLGCSDELKSLLKGGFDLDIPFSSQKLFELSKMDGAIVLSNDLSRIVGANKHLMPDKDIDSKETGMRHRSAEQTAVQSKLPVIAISHRRSVISLYYRDQKYVLQDFNMLLVKASYAVNNLKDFRQKIDNKLKTLISKEINKSNGLKDLVIEIIQDILYFIKHEKQVDEFIVELGSKGQDIANTLYETTFGINEELYLFLRDYSNTPLTRDEALEKLNFIKQLGIRRVADVEKLIEFLGFSEFINNYPADLPRGFRILLRSGYFDEDVVENLITNYKSIYAIKKLSFTDFSKIKGIDVSTSKSIYEQLTKIYNKKI